MKWCVCCVIDKEMADAGFEPAPFQTSALNWRLRPLGQSTTNHQHLRSPFHKQHASTTHPHSSQQSSFHPNHLSSLTATHIPPSTAFQKRIHSSCNSQHNKQTSDSFQPQPSPPTPNNHVLILINPNNPMLPLIVQNRGRNEVVCLLCD